VARDVHYGKTSPFFRMRFKICLNENLNGLFASMNFDAHRRVPKINFVSAAIFPSNNRVRHFCATPARHLIAAKPWPSRHLNAARLRLESAIREARSAGLSSAGVFSAYRPPAFGVGGFSDKFNSLHTYGLAVDMRGIGNPGSPEARRANEINLPPSEVGRHLGGVHHASRPVPSVAEA
jgi:hypothetical protein